MANMMRTALFFILMYCHILYVYGQKKYDYTAELVTRSDRATIGDIHNIYQDSSGTLWLGIYGRGLAYYRGSNIINLSLPNEGIFALNDDVFSAGSGLLVLNYQHGIYIFDPLKFSIIHDIKLSPEVVNKNKIINASIQIIQNDTLVWVTTEISSNDSSAPKYKMLRSTNGSHLESLDLLFQPIGKPVNIATDSGVMIKSNDGLLHLNHEHQSERLYALDDSILIGLDNNNIAIDDDNTLWYSGGFQYKNVYRSKGRYIGNIYKWSEKDTGSIAYEIAYNRGMHYQDHFLNEHLFAKTISWCGNKLIVDRNIYFDIDQSVSRMFSSIDISLLQDYKTSSVGTLFTAYEDATGVIWLGGSNGLAKLVEHPPGINHLPALTLRSFLEDDAGLIIGNRLKYNPKNKEITPSFKSKIAWYKAILHDDKVYHKNSDVNIKTDVLTRYTTYPDLDLGELILKDHKDRIWQMGWNHNTVFIYNSDKSKLLKTFKINALVGKDIELNDWYESPTDHTIWLGTYGNGIIVIAQDGEIQHHYTHSEYSHLQLDNNIVNGFYEDNEGNMWCGTAHGLSKINRDRSDIFHYPIRITGEEIQRMIYGILPEDNERSLWVSSDAGLYKYDIENDSYTDIPLHYIANNQEYNRTSYHKDKEGNMYFGGGRHELPTITFHPDTVSAFYKNYQSSTAPMLVNSYSSTSTDGNKTSKTPLLDGEIITLPPGNIDFQMHYSSSDYRYASAVRYTHLLEGYEDEWSLPSTKGNRIKFEQLTPGDYVLHLSGAVLPPYQKNVRKIKISVLPYWYETTWFKVLLMLSSVGLVLFFFYRRLRMNELRTEAKKKQEVLEFKNRIYDNVTHEFRTPLTIILSMMDTLEMDDRDRAMIKDNANNMLRLVNQMLDLSKFDNHEANTFFVSGNIIDYLKKVTKTFQQVATDKGLVLKYTSDVDPIYTKYNEQKYMHLLYNLLSNAIKFTDGGGTVSVHVSVNGEQDLHQLVIQVRDSGIGISEKDLPYIFDRFYQEKHDDQQKSAIDAGSGIGLSLTQGIVQSMGGEISVKSEKNWGSLFTLTIPYIPLPSSERTISIQADSAESDATLQEQIASNNTADHKPTVLIIEDNENIRTLLKRILSNSYHIIESDNGKDGVTVAIELIPDVIITDIMMPKKDGYYVCSTLKSNPISSHIPIIMLTAKSTFEAKIKGLKEGADAYIMKPFENEELLVRIEKLLELRTLLKLRYSSQQSEDDAISEMPIIEQEFITNLTQIIETKMGSDDITIPEFCKAAHLSHTQLYRKLKAITGQTPSQFIRSVKLKKAKEILKTTNKTIAEIAYEVGFNDASYFTRVFKLEYNLSPGEYRSHG